MGFKHHLGSWLGQCQEKNLPLCQPGHPSGYHFFLLQVGNYLLQSSLFISRKTPRSPLLPHSRLTINFSLHNEMRHLPHLKLVPEVLCSQPDSHCQLQTVPEFPMVAARISSLTPLKKRMQLQEGLHWLCWHKVQIFTSRSSPACSNALAKVTGQEFLETLCDLLPPHQHPDRSSHDPTTAATKAPGA